MQFVLDMQTSSYINKLTVLDVCRLRKFRNKLQHEAQSSCH